MFLLFLTQLRQVEQQLIQSCELFQNVHTKKKKIIISVMISYKCNHTIVLMENRIYTHIGHLQSINAMINQLKFQVIDPRRW